MFPSPHPWITAKRAPSAVLPAIRDDDGEIDSTSETSADADSAFTATPMRTISGEEPWVAMTHEDNIADAAGQQRANSNVERHGASSPVRLYATNSAVLRGSLVSSLSFGSAYLTSGGGAENLNGLPLSPSGFSDAPASYSYLPDLRLPPDTVPGPSLSASEPYPLHPPDLQSRPSLQAEPSHEAQSPPGRRFEGLPAAGRGRFSRQAISNRSSSQLRVEPTSPEASSTLIAPSAKGAAAGLGDSEDEEEELAAVEVVGRRRNDRRFLALAPSSLPAPISPAGLGSSGPASGAGFESPTSRALGSGSGSAAGPYPGSAAAAAFVTAPLPVVSELEPGPAAAAVGPPSALQRQRTRSLGRSRSAGTPGTALMPSKLMVQNMHPLGPGPEIAPASAALAGIPAAVAAAPAGRSPGSLADRQQQEAPGAFAPPLPASSLPQQVLASGAGGLLASKLKGGSPSLSQPGALKVLPHSPGPSPKGPLWSPSAAAAGWPGTSPGGGSSAGPAQAQGAAGFLRRDGRGGGGASGMNSGLTALAPYSGGAVAISPLSFGVAGVGMGSSLAAMQAASRNISPPHLPAQGLAQGSKGQAQGGGAAGAPAPGVGSSTSRSSPAGAAATPSSASSRTPSLPPAQTQPAQQQQQQQGQQAQQQQGQQPKAPQQQQQEQQPHRARSSSPPHKQAPPSPPRQQQELQQEQPRTHSPTPPASPPPAPQPHHQPQPPARRAQPLVLPIATTAASAASEHSTEHTSVSEPLIRLPERGLTSPSPSPGGRGGGAAAFAASPGFPDVRPSSPPRRRRESPNGGGGGGGGGAAAIAAAAVALTAASRGGVKPLTPSLRHSAPLLDIPIPSPPSAAAVGPHAALLPPTPGQSAQSPGARSGMFADAVGGLAPGAELPPAPEVAARPPKWLKPSAFQVSEQLRTGKLQELVDKLAAVHCPTFLDLGGLEFSGPFTPSLLPSAGGDDYSTTTFTGLGGGGGGGSVAAAAGIGAAPNTSPRHRTLRLSLSGIGAAAPSKGRRQRSTETNVSAVALAPQAIIVPAGQHITLYNATLLLTADQYILVGPGASLTLKGVEVLGCSREAARTTAAARRRAAAAAAAAATAAAAAAATAAATAAAAAAASAGPLASSSASVSAPSTSGSSSSAAAAASAPSAAPSTAPSSAAASASPTPPQSAGGGARALRRSSSPGRTDPGLYAPAAPPAPSPPGRRSSVSGGDSGAGLPPVRRRNNTTPGGVPYMLNTLPYASVLQQGSAGLLAALPEIVDPNEYVEEHGLVEVVGGYVRVSNCRIWPGRCQLAVCVSDGGVCNLSYSTAGPCCAAGLRSVLASEQSTYDGGAAGCVSALYGAKLGLSGCQVKYSDSVSASSGPDSGSSTAGAAHDTGLEVRGAGTLAVLSDCEIAHCGVSVSHGARLHMASTRVFDARLYGIHASDYGTAVYGKDCRVDDCGGAAAASEGATLRLADSTLAGNAGVGLLVQAPAAAAAALGSASELRSTAAAAGRTTAALLRCDVSANAGHGVHVTGGSLIAMSECQLYNNLGCGVALEGQGSALVAARSRLIRNEGHGVRAVEGSGAALTRCYAMGNGRDGVAVDGGGSRGQLTRCECRENRESGLCVTGSAHVTLSHTRLAANQHDGLAVGGDGSLAVAHGCVFNGNVAKGAVVCMGGGAELSECAAHCNGSKSVQVSDEDSRLVLGRACSLDRKPVATNGGTLVQLG